VISGNASAEQLGAAAMQNNPVINTINLVNSITKLTNLRNNIQYNMGINNINSLNALNNTINTINTINSLNQTNQGQNDFTLKLIQNMTQLSNLKNKNTNISTMGNINNPLNSGNFSIYSNNSNNEDFNKFNIHNLYNKSANNTLNNFLQNNLMNSANSFTMLTSNNIQPLIPEKVKEEENVNNAAVSFKLMSGLEDEANNGLQFGNYNDGSRQTTRSFFRLKSIDTDAAQFNRLYDENQLAPLLNNIGNLVGNGVQNANGFEKFKTFCDSQQTRSDNDRTSSISPKRQLNVSPKSAFNKINMFK
jgi:hypothetical protein